MMKYTEILTSSAAAISDRSNKYGTPDECFGAIAEITGALLGRPVTEYEVAAFQLGTKLGRHRMNKEYSDNYIDGASYIGFLGHFAIKECEEMRRFGIKDNFTKDNPPPASVTAFAPRRSPKAASAPAELHRSGAAISEDALRQDKSPKAISEDALRLAMDAVSAELDVVVEN